MANRYWVTGGTGNWNSTTNWSTASGGASGASVPGTSDAALLDASSGSGTVTLNISPTIQTLTCTGFTGTLAFGTNTISLNSTGTIFTGATTMAVSGTPQIICTNATATARTITPGAVTEANSISFRITAGTGTLALTAGAFRNLDFTDGTNPTGYGGALGSTNVTVYGDFKASTNMTVTAGVGTFTFAATGSTQTINTAGVVFDRPFTFNGSASAFVLQSALTLGSTRALTLTAGDLYLVGYTITTGQFSSSNSNYRSLINGNVPIIITGNNATVVNFGTTTNFYADVPPTFNLNYSGSVGTRTIAYGALSYTTGVAPNITVSAGSDTITTSGTTTLGNLVFTGGFTGTLNNATRNIYGNLTLVAGMATPQSGALVNTFNGVGSQTITTAGKTLDFPITFDGVGGTWQLQDALTSGSTRTCTLTNGTLNLASYTLTTGLFSSTNSNTRVLAFGTGKIVLTGTSGSIWTTSTSTNLTVTGTNPLIQANSGGAGTRTITMGAAGEANAISLDVTSGSDIVTLATTNGAYKNVNFTGFSGTFNLGNSILVFGNWNFGGVTAVSGTAAVTFSATSGTKTVTSNGVTFPANVVFNGIGGTWACQDALSVTGTLTMTNGTLQLKSGATSTVGAFATSGTNAKYLLSTTFGTAATISDASGTNTVQYLTVQDSIATGGAMFDALGITNVDAGNNTGWLFSTTPSIGNEITMRLRSFTQPRRF